jgi:nucleotide-binding universal stress UspA family protein
MKPKTILVPLDGSPIAEGALPTAVELARETPGAVIVLTRVAEAQALALVDPTTAHAVGLREAQDYLNEVATRLRDRGVAITTSVWYGLPVSAIVQAARAVKADLIVMNSHGRGGLRRAVLGSVAEGVLRRTHTPILLLRDPGAPIDEPAPGEVAGQAKEASRV